MRGLFLLISMFLSSHVLAFSSYDLMSVSHEEIDQYLIAGSDDTGTPRNLQGLWWMDGNPLADEVVSFSSARIEAIEEAGNVIGYKAYIPVYDEGIWSWHDSFSGRSLYRAVEKNQLVYQGIFNTDFSYGDVTPIIKPFGVFPEVEIPQSMLLNFSMSQVSDNEWSRDSVIFGQESSYRFRQIVDGEGNRLPAWDDYLISIEARDVGNALLPVCTRDNGPVLPTSCANF
ncbi:hypothetical protein [Pseudobacteriovorax antillogorgiicola]|uniref:Uncharacterized protein n=1 Tax=Pseudobacteriovorax antillogorgiicola TaxID=1513793 RepID=A0A1Y6BDW1_9BACT|nr:hypothetical protein [Pseudobacteriovorax antillogorgiicola]TCS58640.1 hypothetical protein EDD56_102153 [Pseudobacteriovorax antillogorgiicola]SME96530.1 hypothetical protein SAMN06296036_102290 [Pseudobacteriovorax antillogorgiicola]